MGWITMGELNWESMLRHMRYRMKVERGSLVNRVIGRRWNYYSNVQKAI